MSFAPPPPPAPTRARRVVLVFAVTLSVISFVERAAISQAAPAIKHDLNISDSEMGVVFSLFTFAYALFEVPMGRLGDRFGPRSILLKVVWMWTFFTAATGWVWSLASLKTCRFLFGMGEAGCFPNLTKVITVWLPARERERAQGIFWMFGRWGAGVAPSLVAWLMMVASWRWAFAWLSLLGVAWAILFARWFRDRPRGHPAVNDAELAMLDGAELATTGHGRAPWGLLARRGTVWLLMLQYFCMAYGWYFYITWLPTYLLEARHLDLHQSALLAGVPLFFGGVGCVAGGWMAQRLAAKWGDVRRARKTVSRVGLLSASALMILFTHVGNDALAMVVLGLASFSVDLVMASAWGACMDVGGRHAGALSGSMNMMNVGGAVSAVVVGAILDASKISAQAPASPAAWMLAFTLTSAAYLLGAACWQFIDPVTPLEGNEDLAGPSASWREHA